MLTDPSSRAGSDLFRYISSASKPKKAKHQHQQQQQGQQSGLLDHLRIANKLGSSRIEEEFPP